MILVPNAVIPHSLKSCMGCGDQQEVSRWLVVTEAATSRYRSHCRVQVATVRVLVTGSSWSQLTGHIITLDRELI